MLVYPDNNIIIDYEKQLKVLPFNKSIKYVYSYVHLEELKEAKNNLDNLKNIRFTTIENLTDGRCVFNSDNNVPTLYKANPTNIYSIIENPISNLLSQKLHDASVHWKVDSNPKFLMEKLGIKKIEINNYTPEQIAEKHGNFICFFVEQTCNCKQEVFLSCFNILDALGFWQDKINKGSTMNRLYDANHAYFASTCDYFVTDDRNTRNKANCVYKMYGYNTKAISYKDFIETTNMSDTNKSKSNH